MVEGYPIINNREDLCNLLDKLMVIEQNRINGGGPRYEAFSVLLKQFVKLEKTTSSILGMPCSQLCASEINEILSDAKQLEGEVQQIYAELASAGRYLLEHGISLAPFILKGGAAQDVKPYKLNGGSSQFFDAKELIFHLLEQSVATVKRELRTALPLFYDSDGNPISLETGKQYHFQAVIGERCLAIGGAKILARIGLVTDYSTPSSQPAYGNPLNVGMVFGFDAEDRARLMGICSNYSNP